MPGRYGRSHSSAIASEAEEISKIMSTLPHFNSIKWFSQFSEDGSPIDVSDLQPVLEFALIWNLFERNSCERYVTKRNIRIHIKQALNDDKIAINKYEPYIAFFREHYSRYNEENFLANQLLPKSRILTNDDRRDINLLRGVFAGRKTETRNVIYALFFIAYRVRNNLFHGEKNIYTLHLQKDLFHAINSLISTHLEQICLKVK
jgi:hypothetical protein